MDKPATQQCTAFEGNRCIASGTLAEVAKKTREIMDRDETAAILIFDDSTGEIVEVDFRGTVDAVLKRVSKPAPGIGPPGADVNAARRPGRPKLGVVAREVTLLPRHWDWLNSQPGGASVALRKLVEEARRANSSRDKVRQSQEAAYRFMSAMAGNLPGFEEVTRALFAGDYPRFSSLMAAWPIDIREHARKLSNDAFPRS